MKRNDRKALEDQIRHMDDAPYNPSPEHIEEIKQRAFQQYMARQIPADGGPRRPNHKKKRHSARASVIIRAAARQYASWWYPFCIAPSRASHRQQCQRQLCPPRRHLDQRSAAPGDCVFPGAG